jgi:hypothetical protein
VNLPSKLWRLGKAHAAAEAAAAPTRTIAGFGIVGLVVAGFIHLPTSNSQHVGRKIDLPLLPPIVSSDSTSEQSDLSTTVGVDLKQKQPVRLNSVQIILKEAKVAVSLSQAHLAQARINLTESTAKHNKTKILSAQGRVSRKQADLALASYQLAQLQHSSASIGLQDSTAQLIAARSELSKSRCKPNSGTEM